jgi:hypothetical protein
MTTHRSHMFGVVLGAAAMVSASGGQDAKRPVDQTRNEASIVPLSNDAVERILAQHVRRFIEELGLRDSSEVGLLCVGQADAPNVATPDSGDLTVVTIVKNGTTEIVSNEREMRTDKSVIRFRRIITPNVKSPIGILTTAYSVNGRVELHETVYCMDEHNRWVASTNSRVKPEPFGFDFSNLFRPSLPSTGRSERGGKGKGGKGDIPK